ncbi:hypothetical protein FACS1894124_6250 [Spirochaetia bacterium]|nr:hypothetical protein FACS1894124_6250 [Spirochaetia bacterium]
MKKSMKKRFLRAIAAMLVIGAMAPIFACKTDNSPADNPFTEDKTKTTLDNGGFEDGLKNWLVVEGDAFSVYSIMGSEMVWWDCAPFYAKGSKFLNGYENGEPAVGSIRSQMFTLAGDGFISFMAGGTASANIYITVHKEDGTEIKRYTNTAAFIDPGMALVLHREYMNLSDHIGEVLYIKITDNHNTGGFGALTADDFIVSMTGDDVQALAQSTYDEAMARSDAPHVRASDNFQIPVNATLKTFYRAYDYPFPFDTGEEEYEENPSRTTLVNGGFEDGLKGWFNVDGNIFSELNLKNSTEKFWSGDPRWSADGGRDYFAKGAKFFSTESNEGLTGKFRSEKFTLTGDGLISFLIGGGNGTTVTVWKDGATPTLVDTYSNNGTFADPAMVMNMHREYMNLSTHKGEVLYIQIEDTTENDFGMITADDFIVSMTLAQARTLKQQTLSEANALNITDVSDHVKNFYANYTYPFAD